MTESFINGLVAGYGIAIPVGAIAILIIDMSIRCGWKIGFMAGAGAATADFLYAVLAATAGLLLVGILQPIITPLQYVSALALMGMGGYGIWIRTRRRPTEDKQAEVCGPFKMYGQFLGLTLINPLTIVYFTALIIGGTIVMTGFLERILFVTGAGIASLSWQILLAALGASAGHQLSGTFQKATGYFGNMVVIALGIRILVTMG